MIALCLKSGCTTTLHASGNGSQVVSFLRTPPKKRTTRGPASRTSFRNCSASFRRLAACGRRMQHPRLEAFGLSVTTLEPILYTIPAAALTRSGTSLAAALSREGWEIIEGS